MRENELQRACLLWTRQQRPDLLVLNVHGDGWGNRGFPDLLVLGDRLYLAVELKSTDTGYTLQPEQKLWRDRIQKIGGLWQKVTSLDGFREVVRDAFGDERPGQGVGRVEG